MRRIEFAVRARSDIRTALATSREQFGASAQRHYEALIARAQKLLAQDPSRAGVQQSEHLPPSYFLFHVRHARTRGTPPKQPRHIIVFTYTETRLTIVRVLHDSMDVPQRVTGSDNDP